MSSNKIFKSWKQLYAIVLAFLILQLIVYYFITTHYSA